MMLINRKSVHCAIVVVVGMIIYANTLQVPFYFDDYTNIINVPLVKNLVHFADFTSTDHGFGRRYFGYLTFALNYRFHGLDVTGYHLVNIAIHLAAALLVYRLVSLTFRTPCFSNARHDNAVDPRAGYVALFAALLFVTHPLQTQAVTYIVQRFASLAAMLYLLSLTCYIRARLSQKEPGKRVFATIVWFACALVSAILAMMTKETAFTLPLLILLYELLFFTGKLKRKLLPIACAVPILAGSAAAYWAVSSGRPIMELFSFLDKATKLQTDMSRWDYLATQCRVIVTYLRLVLIPIGQRLEYDYPIYHTFLTPPVFLSAALLCSVVAAAVYCLYLSCKRDNRHSNAAALLRIIAFGIFWFFITHIIESSIIPIVDVIFEHRMYLPSVGLFMAIAAALSLAGNENTTFPGWPRGQILLGSAIVILLLAGMTIARNHLWRNEIALWEDNAAKSLEKGRILLHLGTAYERGGDLVNAELAYREASDLSPDQPFSSVDLGRIYLQQGRLDDALKQFRNALAIDPTMAEAHNNIGKIYELKMQYEEALKEYLQAVRIKPYLAETHTNIGGLYLRQKRYAEAIQAYDKAVVSAPEYEQAYISRGMALLETGRNSEAVADFQRALQINPSNAEAAEQLRRAGNGR